MNQWSDPELEAYAAIDEALRTVELAETPPDLAPGVLARIKALPSLPGFRLTWMDYALSLFIAGMLGLVFLVTRTLPPGLSSYLRLEVLFWIQWIEFEPLAPVMYLGAAGLAVGVVLLVGTLLFRQFSSKES